MSGAVSHMDPNDPIRRSQGSDVRPPPPEQGLGRRLFLVRHGQTSLNSAGVLRGRLDPDLDATGLSEAIAVADSIGPSGLRLVVTSPLARAMETAARIAAVAGLEVEVDGRLIDRDYGPWAGKPKADLIARWRSLDEAPDVEPAAEVYARALDAFGDVAGRLRSGTAALVTHDAVLQFLLPALDPLLDQDEAIPQATGCFNVVEAQGDRWHVTEVNVRPAMP